MFETVADVWKEASISAMFQATPNGADAVRRLQRKKENVLTSTQQQEHKTAKVITNCVTLVDVSIISH